MAINIFKGSIFDCDEVMVIIHQANCFHTMGAGIAKEIAIRYPEALEADLKTIYGDRKKLGGYSWATSKDGRIIVNMYSQYRYGIDVRHTDYYHMENALIKIRNQFHDKVIAVPYKIGCGMAGGNWPNVNEILTRIFNHTTTKLIICDNT